MNPKKKSFQLDREKNKILSNEQGFTLAEVIIALAILIMGMLSVYAAQGNSVRAMGNSRNTLIVTLLAERIMNEKMLEFEKDLKRGALPEDDLEEDGEFEAPFENFRWKFQVKKVEMPIIGDLQNQQPEAASTTPPSQTAASESDQRSVAQLITKKISESVREIRLQIIWEELGVEKDFTLTTHIARLQ